MSTPTSLITLTVNAGSADRAARLVAAIADPARDEDHTDDATIHLPSGPWGVGIERAALHTVEHAPTYHGITYAQCFACGYGTADQTMLEMWNDVSLTCLSCNRESRVLWVLTGGRAFVSTPGGGLSTLRLGNADGTPPDAPGTITGPELRDAEVAPTWPAGEFNRCLNAGKHRTGTRHTNDECPVVLGAQRIVKAREFVRQNPDTMTDLDYDQVAEYVEHHAGGLMVMERPLADSRMVKMHDTWGDDGPVVVHTYSRVLAEDPNETVEHFATGADALACFLAKQ